MLCDIHMKNLFISHNQDHQGDIYDDYQLKEYHQFMYVLYVLDLWLGGDVQLFQILICCYMQFDEVPWHN